MVWCWAFIRYVRKGDYPDWVRVFLFHVVIITFCGQTSKFAFERKHLDLQYKWLQMKMFSVKKWDLLCLVFLVLDYMFSDERDAAGTVLYYSWLRLPGVWYAVHMSYRKILVLLSWAWRLDTAHSSRKIAACRLKWIWGLIAIYLMTVYRAFIVFYFINFTTRSKK